MIRLLTDTFHQVTANYNKILISDRIFCKQCVEFFLEPLRLLLCFGKCEMILFQQFIKFYILVRQFIYILMTSWIASAP